MKKVLTGIIADAGREALERAAKLGADYVDLHFKEEEEVERALSEAKRLGLQVVINIEGRPLEWEPSGRFRSLLTGNETFLGFMLDECDHMQLNAHWPVVEYYGYGGKHYFAETERMGLDEAQTAVERAIAARVERLCVDHKDVAGEYLFPGMMHTAARAGMSASPKVLKETCGPLMIAAGLGASLQYGGTFGIDCDAWWHPETVGHTDERFASALRLAYWAGADRIYIEGGFGACGHPSEESQPEKLGELAKEYIPAHPREYSWRDYRPEVAIIRQDDTCFDIRQKTPREYPGPLYGHIPAKEENTEWLNILSLLSHGYVRTDSASRNWESRSVQARTLFAPFYKLAVFDETVTGTVLDSVKLFFLTGPKISEKTWAEVADRVKLGAVCVLPERMKSRLEDVLGLQKAKKTETDQEADETETDETPEVVILRGEAGKWIVVKDMYALHYETWTSGPCNRLLHRELMPLIGDGESLVYDFGSHIVRAAPKKQPMKNGKTYRCCEIPRAVLEREDDLEFAVERK